MEPIAWKNFAKNWLLAKLKVVKCYQKQRSGLTLKEASSLESVEGPIFFISMTLQCNEEQISLEFSLHETNAQNLQPSGVHTKPKSFFFKFEVVSLLTTTNKTLLKFWTKLIKTVKKFITSIIRTSHKLEILLAEMVLENWKTDACTQRNGEKTFFNVHPYPYFFRPPSSATD